MASEHSEDQTPPFIHKLGLSVFTTVVAHPVNYVKVLIQVGHEPLPPVPSKSILGKDVLRLPGFIAYAKHICNTDGWLGLYRGLTPRIFHHLLSTVVNNAVVTQLECKRNKDVDEVENDLLPPVEYIKETCVMSIGRTVGFIVSYPLQVISVRMMVQFVGRETVYRNVLSSICQIYEDEGISGLFSGVVAALLGDLLSLWIARTISYGLEAFVLQKEWFASSNRALYTHAVSQMGAGIVTYPLQLVANMTAVNTPRLAAGSPPNMPHFPCWMDCWQYVSREGLRRRGESIFIRTISNRK